MSKNNKASKNILTAFALNLIFVFIEVAGGLFTNSIAILSDSIHDLGDCLAIGGAFVFEKISNKGHNDTYTYGYRRYSLISAVLTASILVAGSIIVIISSVNRIKNPEEINGKGMLIIAVFGIIINGFAAFRMSRGHNVNEKVISLHMLEDVLGWAAILIGSIFISIFNIKIIDPILSIAVALFLLYEAVKNIFAVVSILLEKKPRDFDLNAYKTDLSDIKNVIGIHHVHVWSMDGEDLLATVHAVVPANADITLYNRVKHDIKEKSEEYHIYHLTLQIDTEDDCTDDCCQTKQSEMPEGMHAHKHHSH